MTDGAQICTSPFPAFGLMSRMCLVIATEENTGIEIKVAQLVAGSHDFLYIVYC